jgi:hypothetical protein
MYEVEMGVDVLTIGIYFLARCQKAVVTFARYMSLRTVDVWMQSIPDTIFISVV